jgi:hypothetical protein
MPQNAPGGKAARSLLRISFYASPMLAVLCLMYLAFPAQSQINGRVTTPSYSAAAPTTANDEEDTVTPKAPVQAELPPPPPTKYVPGMAEALIATGPVSDAENKDLDAALGAFHDAPGKTPGGDYDDYAKALLAFISAHPDSNRNAALYTNIGLGYCLSSARLPQKRAQASDPSSHLNYSIHFDRADSIAPVDCFRWPVENG